MLSRIARQGRTFLQVYTQIGGLRTYSSATQSIDVNVRGSRVVRVDGRESRSYRIRIQHLILRLWHSLIPGRRTYLPRTLVLQWYSPVARGLISGTWIIGHLPPCGHTNRSKYVDFTAGIAVVGLGHADRAIAQLLYDQALQLTHCSNLYHSPWPGELAKLIIETTKKLNPSTPFQRLFICNSGTEANEGALKFARKIGKQRSGPQKTGLVCFERGFHGRTFGALSVTPQPKYQKPFAPMVPDVRVGELNDVAALDGLIDERTCGVIVEPIQGEGGVFEATEEFLVALRARCNKVGAVLIFDEIQVGSNGMKLTIVWIVEDGQIMGSPSLSVGGGARYCYNGETVSEWISNWSNNDLGGSRRGD
jgi:Aminotransferase class-III